MAVRRLQLHRFLVLCVLLFIANVHAKCSNPSVRREWRRLSRTERTEWIDAVKCLRKLPHDPSLTPTVNLSTSLIPAVNTSSSFLDDIAYVHMDLNTKIHLTGFFLPWHRQFVWGVEKALKDKCGFNGTQPYWDWTQDAPDFYHATIFDDDPESGLGGWGDPDNDFQITTGAFAKDFTVSYPAPHTIRRNYTLQPYIPGASVFGGINPSDPGLYINTTFTKNNTDYMLRSFDGDYEGFQAYFEGLVGPHGGPHLILGGDLGGTCPGNAPAGCIGGAKWTPNDPLFWLHHAMVDKVWTEWQNRKEMNQYSYQGGSVSVVGNLTLLAQFPTGEPPFLNFASVIPGDGLLWGNVTIWDAYDTRSGELCYVYE